MREAEIYETAFKYDICHGGNCIFRVLFSRFGRASILFSLFFAIMYEITFNSHIMEYIAIVRKAAYRTKPLIFGFPGNITASFLISCSRAMYDARASSKIDKFRAIVHRATCTAYLFVYFKYSFVLFFKMLSIWLPSFELGHVCLVSSWGKALSS